jgi:hypothetical protein
MRRGVAAGSGAEAEIEQEQKQRKEQDFAAGVDAVTGLGV